LTNLGFQSINISLRGIQKSIHYTYIEDLSNNDTIFSVLDFIDIGEFLRETFSVQIKVQFYFSI